MILFFMVDIEHLPLDQEDKDKKPEKSEGNLEVIKQQIERSIIKREENQTKQEKEAKPEFDSMDSYLGLKTGEDSGPKTSPSPSSVTNEKQKLVEKVLLKTPPTKQESSAIEDLSQSSKHIISRINSTIFSTEVISTIEEKDLSHTFSELENAYIQEFLKTCRDKEVNQDIILKVLRNSQLKKVTTANNSVTIEFVSQENFWENIEALDESTPEGKILQEFANAIQQVRIYKKYFLQKAPIRQRIIHDLKESKSIERIFKSKQNNQEYVALLNSNFTPEEDQQQREFKSDYNRFLKSQERLYLREFREGTIQKEELKDILGITPEEVQSRVQTPDRVRNTLNFLAQADGFTPGESKAIADRPGFFQISYQNFAKDESYKVIYNPATQIVQFIDPVDEKPHYTVDVRDGASRARLLVLTKEYVIARNQLFRIFQKVLPDEEEKIEFISLFPQAGSIEEVRDMLRLNLELEAENIRVDREKTLRTLLDLYRTVKEQPPPGFPRPSTIRDFFKELQLIRISNDNKQVRFNHENIQKLIRLIGYSPFGALLQDYRETSSQTIKVENYSPEPAVPLLLDPSPFDQNRNDTDLRQTPKRKRERNIAA